MLDAVRTAHAHHFVAVVDEHAPRLRGGHQIGALHLLAAERENVVAALRHLADTGDAGRAVHLACELVWFAVLSGNAADALDWIRIALQADGDADPAERSFVRSVVAVADAQDHDAPATRRRCWPTCSPSWRPSTPSTGRRSCSSGRSCPGWSATATPPPR